jgi:hypothetical protein
MGSHILSFNKSATFWDESAQTYRGYPRLGPEGTEPSQVEKLLKAEQKQDEARVEAKKDDKKEEKKP